MTNIIRLYINTELIQDDIVHLSNEDHHYIYHVMRKKLGDQLKLFNEKDGQWLGQIITINKKETVIKLESQLTAARPQSLDLWLIFSPIKNTRMPFMIEKAVELGITKFLPVITSHSYVRELNISKFKIIIKEATEQCERLDMPAIVEVQKLTSLCSNWQEGRQIILCSELEKQQSINHISKQLKPNNQYAIMIGPEGGFSPEEQDALRNFSFITPVHLGSNILRAETASIMAISCISMQLGAFNSPPIDR